MSIAKDTFVAVFGKPKPKAPNAIHFKTGTAEEVWQLIVADTGAGYFMNRFLFLFGKGIEKLEACLEAWSFVAPPSRDRMILGRNAYGSILALENASSTAGARRVHVLDPFRVSYSRAGAFDHLSLIASALPERRIPHFLDSELYDAWIEKRATPLDDDVILAPKTPLGLGGKMVAANFQEEDIISFYKTSAPIYEKAFRKMGRPLPAKRPKA